MSFRFNFQAESGTAPDRAETHQIDDAQAKEVIINSEDQREVRHCAFGCTLLRTAQSPFFDLLVQGGTNGLEAVPLTPSFSLYKVAETLFERVHHHIALQFVQLVLSAGRSAK